MLIRNILVCATRQDSHGSLHPCYHQTKWGATPTSLWTKLNILFNRDILKRMDGYLRGIGKRRHWCAESAYIHFSWNRKCFFADTSFLIDFDWYAIFDCFICYDDSADLCGGTAIWRFPFSLKYCDGSFPFLVVQYIWI